MSSSLMRCAAVISSLFLMVAFGHAQSINGRIIGTVTDPNGAVVPKASVSVTNEGTGAQRTVEADDSGTYVVPELPVGLYTISVAAANFASANRPHIKVDVGTETRVDVAMLVQGATAEVTINDQSPVLQSDSSALAEVITSRQVESLPLNGRDFRRLT
ncbi:MAG: carboxypeptidase-like regulatory domain-containing protein, partial [Pyrinomonadaceae bacterium]